MVIIAICISLLMSVLALFLCFLLLKTLQVIVKIEFNTTVQQIIDEYEKRL